jgi:hypothetical protein
MEIAPGLENDIENHTRNSMAILKTTLNLYWNWKIILYWN